VTSVARSNKQHRLDGKGNTKCFCGYSLVEFLLVFLCASVLLTAAVPNFHALRQEWTLLGSAKLLESSLHWGRMRAISTNTPLMFEVDEGGRRFFWTDPLSGDTYGGSVRHLSSQVRIVAYPKRPLRFYQHGNAAPAGTYTIQGETGSYSVVVSPGGRIRFQKN
jgi:Tfp pilus assembly protein FimT